MAGLKFPNGIAPSSWTRLTPLHYITGIVWASAVLASMSALYGLAVTYGGWQSLIGVLFPGCIDLYWIAALGVALDGNLSGRARVAAAAHSAAAFLLSAAGQLLYHELHAGDAHLGHLAPLAVGVIALVPAVAGVALAHLLWLHRASPTAEATVPVKPKRTVPPRQAATVPASRASRASRAGGAEPDRASPTVPATVPNRATSDGTVPDPTVPDHATGTVPPAVPAATVPAATVPSGEFPAPLKAGGRPDPIAIQAARDIWQAAVKAGRIHNDRSLTDAVNEHFGYKVIGRTSAGSVIAEESDARRRLA